MLLKGGGSNFSKFFEKKRGEFSHKKGGVSKIGSCSIKGDITNYY